MQFSRLSLKHWNTKIPHQLGQEQLRAPLIDNALKVSSLIRGMRFVSHYPKSTNYHYSGNHAIALTYLLLILAGSDSGRIWTCMLRGTDAKPGPSPFSPEFPTVFPCWSHGRDGSLMGVASFLHGIHVTLQSCLCTASNGRAVIWEQLGRIKQKNSFSKATQGT